jgi:mannose-6-phosphate isomerase-like protein (cupin superfamily)
MADYTHVNLKEIEDQAPKFGMSGLEFRVARSPLELSNSAVSYMRLEPNFRLPFGHTHNEQEELYVLVSGNARLKLGEEVIDLQPFDAVRIPKDTMRNLEGGPEGAEVILFGAPNTGPNDAEMTPDWWTD